MKLEPDSEHPHGLSDKDFDALFTKDKPVIFAYHGYPWLIHRLTYRRTNHDNMHVRGYKEEGTTTTPFDMVVMNDLDRFHLAGDVIDRVPSLGSRVAYAKQFLRDKLIEHKNYVHKHGQDMPDVREWRWNPTSQANAARAPITSRTRCTRQPRRGQTEAPDAGEAAAVNVLVLNAGSSSLKFRLLAMKNPETVLASGLVEKWGTPQAALRMEMKGRPPDAPLGRGRNTHPCR